MLTRGFATICERAHSFFALRAQDKLRFCAKITYTAVSMAHIGTKLRYFRLRSKLSQIDLELEAGRSFGSICRIESGKVNPTKETVISIADVLKIEGRELDYLIGKLAEPADEETCQLAIADVESYFARSNVFAYLVDDRYRLIDISSGFLKIINKTKAQLIGKSIVWLAIDEKFGIRTHIKSSSFYKTIERLLERFYSEVGFMIQDEYYKQAVSAINADAKAKLIWKNITTTHRKMPIHTIEDRTVAFSFYGVSVSMVYANETLQRHRRFDIVEYIPSSKVVRLLLDISSKTGI